MDTNKMREQFESAWRARYPAHGDIALKRSGLVPEDYCNTRVKDAWWAWQASRKAVVVDLPKSRADKGETANGDQSLLSALVANHMAIEQCKESILAQGLKVAP